MTEFSNHQGIRAIRGMSLMPIRIRIMCCIHMCGIGNTSGLIQGSVQYKHSGREFKAQFPDAGGSRCSVLQSLL